MLKICSMKITRLPNAVYIRAVCKSTSANYANKSTGVNYPFLNKSIESLVNNENKLCLVDKYRKFTYNDILSLTKRFSSSLIERYRRESNLSRRVNDLNSAKVGIYCTNNYTYLISILAVWLANGVPFCLNKSFPPKFIEYYLDDSQCKLVINSKSEEPSLSPSSQVAGEFDELLEKKKIVNFKLDENFHSSAPDCYESPISFERFVSSLSENETEREALLLYTSGTSGPSKGVVITFENFFSAIENMVECYKWSSNDFCLNPLPINHYSGLVYCLLTPFFVGASVDLLPKFNAEVVWRKLLELDPKTIDSKLNLFIAVPTIYSQLVHSYATNDQLRKQYPVDYIQKTLRSKMRIIASGSAPLSIKTFEDWHELTNFRILERYGMTEIGMALSTSYSDLSRRVGGTIGRPCGKNRCRVYDNSTDQVLLESDSDSDVFLNGAEGRDSVYGELQVKGPNVFKKYFNKPKETEVSFTQDGWFKTGDTVEFLKDAKVFKIVGRTSVDVIKSGGHKLSALDVERELITNEMVEDVAVIGLKDVEWGQRVLAMIVLKPNAKYNYTEFIKWCKSRMPKYSVPRLIEIVDKIPKNQLGKINKKDLIQFYEKKYENIK